MAHRNARAIFTGYSLQILSMEYGTYRTSLNSICVQTKSIYTINSLLLADGAIYTAWFKKLNSVNIRPMARLARAPVRSRRQCPPSQVNSFQSTPTGGTPVQRSARIFQQVALLLCKRQFTEAVIRHYRTSLSREALLWTTNTMDTEKREKDNLKSALWKKK